MKKTIEEYFEVIFPANEQQLTFFQSVFGDPCKRLLDVGCSSGNHAIALCKKGYIVTGVDINEHSIFRARDKATAEQVDAKFIIGNILRLTIPINEIFHGIYCIGNVLPHLQNIEEVKQALQHMYNLLEKGGKIIIQIVNYNQENLSFPILQRENFRFIRRQDNARFHVKIESLEGLSLYESMSDVLQMKNTDIVVIMEDIGFRHLHIFGDYTKESYIPSTSNALIIVGEKH